jgi:hypothetical protein
MDDKGVPYHEGACEPPHPLNSRLAEYWKKREEEERAA